ncbi:MAG TPA: CpcT/CpeT family chromophore lyase [Steroidobacteraceae bacterium]|nr:CpcT/CpeT family chromophore lyase [Steroidobacteraceae bacterium]
MKSLLRRGGPRWREAIAVALLFGVTITLDAAVEPAASVDAHTAAPAQSAADVLMQTWPGVRDSSEQLIVSPDRGPATYSDREELRVRTVVARVQVPWLGQRVLYLEEFLHDDPSAIRRQLLLKIEPDGQGARRVRAFPYTFKNSEHWRQLNRSPRLLRQLKPSDIQAPDGCDLVLRQEGEQFRGGTIGLDCEDDSKGEHVYVDYRMVIGPEIYWYRRRLLRESDDALVEEVMGYNWFEPNDARLFTCRVDWSVTGKPADLHPLTRLDVHDQGGRARFTTPDQRKFELSLHSEDWPFAGDRDALILLLEDAGTSTPVASSWTALDARQIDIDLGWMTVRCGPLVPETDEVVS